MERLDLTRSLLETTIAKILREIRSDPERSIRKLLDLAQSVSRGRFQKRFFAVAQHMMEDESSAYYAMVSDLVAHTNPERIRTFGINLGYNGCALGAKRIRENEAMWHFDIPWNIFLAVGRDGVRPEDVDGLITQGKALGIYVYLIDSDHALNAAYHAVFKKHADCAFILFTQPDEVLDTVVATCGDLTNCLIAADQDGRHIREAAAELRAEGFLYGTYRRYGGAPASALLSEAELARSKQYGGVFLLFLPSAPGLTAGAEAFGRSVARLCEEQRYPFVPMDVQMDTLRIDRIISNSPCSVAFDAAGQLYTLDGVRAGKGANYLSAKLKDILTGANAWVMAQTATRCCKMRRRVSAFSGDKAP